MLLFPALLLAGFGDSTYIPSLWRTQVPPVTRALHDPLPQTAANVEAGREVYNRRCAGCHATDGGGRRGRPSLRTARVRGETDGEIFWILENGSKGHGMPAWRQLGDTALWQLVEYIRSMPPAAQ